MIKCHGLPFQAALAISLRNNYTLAGPYTGYQVSSLYSIQISFDPAMHVTVIGLDIKVTDGSQDVARKVCNDIEVT